MTLSWSKLQHGFLLPQSAIRPEGRHCLLATGTQLVYVYVRFVHSVNLAQSLDIAHSFGIEKCIEYHQALPLCSAGLRKAKPLLLEADWDRTVMMVSSHSSLKYECSPQLIDHWFNLWDVALDFVPRGTRLAQLLFRIVSQPVY